MIATKVTGPPIPEGDDELIALLTPLLRLALTGPEASYPALTLGGRFVRGGLVTYRTKTDRRLRNRLVRRVSREA